MLRCIFVCCCVLCYAVSDVIRACAVLRCAVSASLRVLCSAVSASLRVLCCAQVPLINVLLPFVWKSFPFIFTADVAAVVGVYAWKVRQGAAVCAGSLQCAPRPCAGTVHRVSTVQRG